jgi:hypothetical protein
MDSPDRYIGKAFRDVLLLGAVLALINYLAALSDFGWLRLNPSPWLLLPALIGVRYGVIAGVLAGLVGGVGIASVNAGMSSLNTHQYVQQHSYFFALLILAGYLAGECQRFLWKDNLNLRTLTDRQADENARLRAELDIARETRQQLQQHLALNHAEMTGLDEDLRKVIGGSGEGLFERFLAAAQQHTQVVSAAFYRRQAGALQQVAVLHATKRLPARLSLAEAPMARRALEERMLVSVASAVECSSTQPYLAALPFEDSMGEGVLLIQDMPLRTFNWAYLARVELMLQWVLALKQHRDALAGEGPQLATIKAFRLAVKSALVAEQVHHVPSVVVRADFQDAQLALGSKLRLGLLKLLPSTAVAAQLTDGGSLLVLLPFGGEMEATALIREWQSTGMQLRASHYLVAGTSELDEFWQHVAQA